MYEAPSKARDTDHVEQLRKMQELSKRKKEQEQLRKIRAQSQREAEILKDLSHVSYRPTYVLILVLI